MLRIDRDKKIIGIVVAGKRCNRFNADENTKDR